MMKTAKYIAATLLIFSMSGSIFANSLRFTNEYRYSEYGVNVRLSSNINNIAHVPRDSSVCFVGIPSTNEITLSVTPGAPMVAGEVFRAMSRTAPLQITKGKTICVRLLPTGVFAPICTAVHHVKYACF